MAFYQLGGSRSAASNPSVGQFALQSQMAWLVVSAPSRRAAARSLLCERFLLTRVLPEAVLPPLFALLHEAGAAGE